MFLSNLIYLDLPNLHCHIQTLRQTCFCWQPSTTSHRFPPLSISSFSHRDNDGIWRGGLKALVLRIITSGRPWSKQELLSPHRKPVISIDYFGPDAVNANQIWTQPIEVFGPHFRLEVSCDINWEGGGKSAPPILYLKWQKNTAWTKIIFCITAQRAILHLLIKALDDLSGNLWVVMILRMSVGADFGRKVSNSCKFIKNRC